MQPKFILPIVCVGLSLGCGAQALADTMQPTIQPPTNGAVMTKPLTKMQEYVTKKDGTEPPFQNEYWDNHAPGIYVDVVSGEVLFSSKDKFDSGTGWPSFTKPLVADNITTHTDSKLGMTRTEVRSAKANSHLGHVFDDGPRDQGGLRYCMNSAAMRFIPADRLVAEGYADYAKLFVGDKK